MSEMKEIQPQLSPVYTAAAFFLLRAPAFSTYLFSQLAATGASSISQQYIDFDNVLVETRDHCYGLLQSLITQPIVEKALATASTAIFEGLARIQRGEKSRRTERTYSRLLRYLVRMSTRPTPFGLFAGIATGTFAEETTLRLSASALHHFRTRPDMSWLLAIIRQIEQTPELLPRLHVVINQAVYLAGGRVVLPHADVYGQRDTRSITIRATPVVQHILERARYPLPYEELRAGLLAHFSHATPQQVDNLLKQLWENHFLTSNLRPPLTDAEPARYLLDRLRMLPGAESICSSLEQVLQKTEEIDRTGFNGPIELFQDLTHYQEQLVSGNQNPPFQVDATLNLASSHLNHSLGQAAALAAETLLRLSRFPRGLLTLQEYRNAFIERYGMEAEIPVLDLLSPEVGLDVPSAYTEPPRTYKLPNPLPPPDYRMRDAILCEMVSQAVNDRSMEIELTEELLHRLEQWTPQSENAAPSSLEIYLQLHAASHEDLDNGNWRAVISPNCGSPGGGRTFSRFFDLLEVGDREKLQQFIKCEEALSNGVIFAELSYLPTMARAANVAVRPALHDYEIVINTTPSVPAERVLQLNDLVVGIRDNRFYLRSLRLNKEVIVCQSHMLNPMKAPNICRFLTEIAHDNAPGLMPFDWGVASNLPFLPRVVRGRIVVSLAQWNLKAATIQPTGSGSEEARWFAGLQEWRTRWRVPRYVYIVEADNRLLLDLEHPLMALELRNELTKVDDSGSVSIQEMLPDFDHLWLRDSDNAPYISEIVVPLLRSSSAPSHNLSAHEGTKSISPPRIVSRQERHIPPGDAWTYLKLYCAFKQHDACIAGPLREIVSTLQEQSLIDRWFFIRYADPEPHLRIRFHAANPQVSKFVLTAALAWGRQQVAAEMASRLSVDTYDREIERYGGPDAIDLLEQVFAIDSALTSNIIEAQYTRRLTLDSIAVAVYSLDQFFAAWGLDFQARLRRLEKRIHKNHSSEQFHTQRRLFSELLAPQSHISDASLAAQRDLLHSLHAILHQQLQGPSTQLRLLASQGKLWQYEEALLDSLAHMHVNRLIGVGAEQESKIYAFWRHTLTALNSRSSRQNPLVVSEKGRL
jgi:thiopeptide-type bacteriocin biosynthesis protein